MVVITTVTVYFLGCPPSRATNFLGALGLGVWISSLWYLPRIDFFRHFLEIAYGGRGDQARLLTLSAYTYYPEQLIKEGMSPPLALYLGGVLLYLGLSAWWRSRRAVMERIKEGIRGLAEGSWLLGLWVVIPLLIFTLASHRDSRSIMPVLPALALALAGLLLSRRSSVFRSASIAAMVSFCLIQFTVLSCDAWAWLPGRLAVNLPLLGDTGLFGRGVHLEWPNQGINDGRYQVLPALLDAVTQDSVHQPVRLASLLNRRTINGYQLQYLTRTRHPQIELLNLSTTRNRLPAYPQIFGSDYFVTRTREEPESVVEPILDGPPPAFQEHFRLLASYHLPGGDEVYLFKKVRPGIPKRFPPELLCPVPSVEQTTWGEELSLLGYDLAEKERAGPGRVGLTLYWLALKPMQQDYIIHLKLVNGVFHVWGAQAGRPYWDLRPTDKWRPGQVTEDIRQIDLLPGTPPGFYAIEVDLYDADRERFVNGGEGGEEGEPFTLGPVEIPRQDNLSAEALDIEHRLEVNLADKVRLLGYNIESGLRPGDALHLTLFWQCLVQMDESYTVFTHLLDEEGKIWGQKDNEAVDGFYPTDAWQEGEMIRDQYDIPIAPEAPPGRYSIRVGMYQAESLLRLPVSSGPPGDAVLLSTISIEE